MKQLILTLTGICVSIILFAQTPVKLGDTTVIINAKLISRIPRLTNDVAMKPNGFSAYYIAAEKSAFMFWTADFDETGNCTDLRSYHIAMKDLDTLSPITCQPVQDKTFAAPQVYSPQFSPVSGLTDYIDAVSYSAFQPHAQPYKESFCNIYFAKQTVCESFGNTISEMIKRELRKKPGQ